MPNISRTYFRRARVKELSPAAHGLNGSSDGRPSRFGLVVFDLDGTLIDSSADLCAAVNATLTHFGFSTLAEPKITSFIGGGAAALVERAVKASVVRCDTRVRKHAEQIELDEALAFFLAFYREHKLDRTLPYPGVLESLARIRQRQPDLPMAVLTNKPVRPSREICSALGLSDFFFEIYGGDSNPKKPDPTGLKRLIAETQGLGELVPTSRVLMVGDSPIDVETARRCGALSRGCTYGLSPQSLQASGPDLIVDHPAGWVGILAP